MIITYSYLDQYKIISPVEQLSYYVSTQVIPTLFIKGNVSMTNNMLSSDSYKTIIKTTITIT